VVLGCQRRELYGHHKKFADLTLGLMPRTIEAASLESMSQTWPRLCNASPHLGGPSLHPPWMARERVELFRTAWAAGAGTGGCAMDARRGWSQAGAVLCVRRSIICVDRAADFFAEAGGELFADPWQARDAYGAIVDAPAEQRMRHLQSMGRGPLKHGHTDASRRALG